MSQYLKAVDLAIEKHAEQKYGKLPYIAHLMEVAGVYMARNTPKGWPSNKQYSESPELDAGLAVCYLHDIVEDTEITCHDLDKEFDMDVVHAVALLTKKPVLDYESYIGQIKAYPLAREVKICDTIANLANSVKEGNHKRIKKYSEQFELLLKED